MLYDIFKYSDTFAKVQAMSGKLLKNADYDTLLSKDSIAEIASYLKNSTHYSDDLANVNEASLHRGQLEEILNEAKAREFARLIRFERGANKRFLLTYVLKYEIEILKEVLRMLKSGLLPSFYHEVSEHFKRYFTVDIQSLSKSQSIRQFIEGLKGTDYYSVFSKMEINDGNFNIFNIEMMLDIYYFNRVFTLCEKLLSKNDAKLVREMMSRETDILNLLWIVRSKRYFNTPKEIIYSYILPNRYMIRDAQIKELVEAKTEEDMQAVLASTPYSKVFERDNLFLEQHFTEYMRTHERKTVRRRQYSIVTVLNYINSCDVETSNIIKIIEGKRYKLSVDEIEPYLIRNGGAA